MKKIFTLSALLLLNACVYAGEVDLWPGRKQWIENFSSYPIDFASKEEKLVKEDVIYEKSFKLKELYTAFKGYSVLSEKKLVKRSYASQKVRAVGNVILSNSSAPYEFKNNQILSLIGYVDLEGRRYGLVPTNLENFVVLFDEKTGKVYPYTGMIKNNRLVVIEQEFVPSNKEFRFENSYITRTEQSKPVGGFDIKFDGVRMERMWFVYYDYASSDAGDFKEYSFPAKPGTVGIHGVKIKVLSVDEQKLDYMLLQD